MQPVRQEAQHAVHGPLVRCKADSLLQKLADQVCAGHLVAVDQLHDLADHFAVALIHLSHGHADQGKLELVGHIDEPAVHLFHHDADIEEDHAHLADAGQAAKVGALQLHVVGIVHKAGDGKLIAEKLNAVEQLGLYGGGPRIFQYGNRGHHPCQSARAAKHLRPAHGRQLHDIRHCNAHRRSPCPLGQILN